MINCEDIRIEIFDKAIQKKKRRFVMPEDYGIFMGKGIFRIIYKVPKDQDILQDLRLRIDLPQSDYTLLSIPIHFCLQN